MSFSNKIILEAKGVSKYFGTITALEDVNLTIKEGECLGVVGDNGAGKSTFMKVLSGLYKPSKGALYFNTKPNYDSLLPAVAHIKKDILRLMETLQWKDE